MAENNELHSLRLKLILGIFAFMFVFALFFTTLLANEFVFAGFVFVTVLAGFVISIKAELWILEFYGLPAGYIRGYKWLYIFNVSVFIIVFTFAAIIQKYSHGF